MKLKVFTKYISREFIKYQVFCLFIFVSLASMIDFVMKIDNFVEKKVFRAEVIFPYFIYKIPYFLIYVMPVATLISIITLFHMMNKNREILAVKSCGISIVKLINTAVVVSLVVSLLSFVFSETVVPFTFSKSEEIWNVQVEKKDASRFRGSDQIWQKSVDSGAIYWIKHFDSIRKVMQDPVMYFFDKSFKIIKRIEAKKGTWQDGLWKLENGKVMVVRSDGTPDEKTFSNLLINISETPEDFQKQLKQPEEMTYSELSTEARNLKNEGYDNTSYLVGMNFKISIPLISFVLTLLGIPIALKLKVGGIPLAVAAGMGLFVLYYVVMITSRALGLSGMLPPLLSAWTANLLFIFIGLYLIMTVEQ